MPRMDGYELLSTLRASPAYQAVPVVMLTSRSGEKHRNKAFSLGASDYLVKPYEDETLLARIRALVGRTRQVAGV
jgi:chemosensory pili system protein ChpA (sensor histidine kinase/response regulator)